MHIVYRLYWLPSRVLVHPKHRSTATARAIDALLLRWGKLQQWHVNYAVVSCTSFQELYSPGRPRPYCVSVATVVVSGTLKGHRRSIKRKRVSWQSSIIPFTCCWLGWWWWPRRGWLGAQEIKLNIPVGWMAKFNHSHDTTTTSNHQSRLYYYDPLVTRLCSICGPIPLDFPVCCRCMYLVWYYIWIHAMRPAQSLCVDSLINYFPDVTEEDSRRCM